MIRVCNGIEKKVVKHYSSIDLSALSSRESSSDGESSGSDANKGGKAMSPMP